MHAFELNDSGMQQAMQMFALPNWIRRIYVWFVRYIKRDEVYAGLLDGWYEKRISEYWPLVVQREDYRRRWFEMWNEEGLDFVLTVPNALPAVPHGGMKEGFKACGYTFLFNLVCLFSSSVRNVAINGFSWTILLASCQSRMLTRYWINLIFAFRDLGMPSRRDHIRCMTL